MPKAKAGEIDFANSPYKDIIINLLDNLADSQLGNKKLYVKEKSSTGVYNNDPFKRIKSTHCRILVRQFLGKSKQKLSHPLSSNLWRFKIGELFEKCCARDANGGLYITEPKKTLAAALTNHLNWLDEYLLSNAEEKTVRIDEKQAEVDRLVHQLSTMQSQLTLSQSSSEQSASQMTMLQKQHAALQLKYEEQKKQMEQVMALNIKQRTEHAAIVRGLEERLQAAVAENGRLKQKLSAVNSQVTTTAKTQHKARKPSVTFSSAKPAVRLFPSSSGPRISYTTLNVHRNHIASFLSPGAILMIDLFRLLPRGVNILKLGTGKQATQMIVTPELLQTDFKQDEDYFAHPRYADSKETVVFNAEKPMVAIQLSDFLKKYDIELPKLTAQVDQRKLDKLVQELALGKLALGKLALGKLAPKDLMEAIETSASSSSGSGSEYSFIPEPIVNFLKQLDEKTKLFEMPDHFSTLTSDKSKIIELAKQTSDVDAFLKRLISKANLIRSVVKVRGASNSGRAKSLSYLPEDKNMEKYCGDVTTACKEANRVLKRLQVLASEYQASRVASTIAPSHH